MRLLIAIIPILAVVVGVLLARYGQRDKLPSNDRKELIAARNLIDELTVSASEHVVLGDNFASIVLDEIRKYRRELR